MIKRRIAVALLFMLSACNKEQKPQTSAAWDQYVAGYLNGYFTAHPDQGVGAGRHEFDGRLPDWSKQGLSAELTRLHAEHDRASAFKDGLDDRQKFERDYLISTIDADLFWLLRTGESAMGSASVGAGMTARKRSFTGATEVVVALGISRGSKTEVHVTVKRKGTACSTKPVSPIPCVGSTSLAFVSTITTCR